MLKFSARTSRYLAGSSGSSSPSSCSSSSSTSARSAAPPPPAATTPPAGPHGVRDRVRSGYANAERQYRQMLGEQLPRGVRNMGLPLQALNERVGQKILLAEARDLGLAVTDAELRRRSSTCAPSRTSRAPSSATSATHDPAAHRLHPATFEQAIRDDPAPEAAEDPGPTSTSATRTSSAPTASRSRRRRSATSACRAAGGRAPGHAAGAPGLLRQHRTVSACPSSARSPTCWSTSQARAAREPTERSCAATTTSTQRVRAGGAGARPPHPGDGGRRHRRGGARQDRGGAAAARRGRRLRQGGRPSLDDARATPGRRPRLLRPRPDGQGVRGRRLRRRGGRWSGRSRPRSATT